MLDVILSRDTIDHLLKQLNDSCNTGYQRRDIKQILEYRDLIRDLMLIEVIFSDFKAQRYIKSSLKMDNLL